MYNARIFFYLTLAVIIVAWFRNRQSKYHKNDGKVRKLPPSPRSYVPFGLDLLYQMASNYDHIFPTYIAWKSETKSNTFAAEVFGDVGVIVLDPDSIQHFLVKNWTNYVKGEKFIASFEDLLGDGIFNSNGDDWRFHRTAARPHFQRMELNMMVPTMTKHTKFLLQHLERACASKQTIDIQKYFFQLTLDSAGDILFGTNIDSLNDPASKFGAAFDSLQAATSFRAIVYYLWKAGLVAKGDFDESMAYMNAFVDKIVDEAYLDAKLEAREDLLAQYVKASLKQEKQEKITDGDKGGDKGGDYDNSNSNSTNTSKMDKIYMRNMLKNMLIAGRDTTACLLSWTIYELSQHPDVERKLLEEIDQHIGLDNDEPTGAQLAELKYMKQVLNEALRLHPSVPVDVRTSVEEDWLPNGYYIPPKSDVIYVSYLTHRLPEYWGADADKFDPARWEPDRIRNVPPFAFVPFHAGPRICLGQNLAYEEAKLALVLILQKYHLQLACRPEEVDYRNIIILQVKGSLNVHVTPREKLN